MTRDDRNDLLKLGAAGLVLWLLLRGGRGQGNGSKSAMTTLGQLAPPCRLLVLPGDQLQLNGQPATVAMVADRCRGRRLDVTIRGDARSGFADDTLAALRAAGIAIETKK